MLEPHETKKELIPSDSEGEDEMKTVVSHRSKQSFGLNPLEEDVLFCLARLLVMSQKTKIGTMSSLTLVLETMILPTKLIKR